MYKGKGSFRVDRERIFAQSAWCGNSRQSGQLWIRKTLNVDPVHLWIKRSQLRWFSHVSRMSQARLVSQVLLATPTGKRLRCGLMTMWFDLISELAWSCLDVEPAERSEIALDRGNLSPRTDLTGITAWDQHVTSHYPQKVQTQNCWYFLSRSYETSF